MPRQLLVSLPGPTVGEGDEGTLDKTYTLPHLLLRPRVVGRNVGTRDLRPRVVRNPSGTRRRGTSKRGSSRWSRTQGARCPRAYRPVPLTVSYCTVNTETDRKLRDDRSGDP